MELCFDFPPDIADTLKRVSQLVEGGLNEALSNPKPLKGKWLRLTTKTFHFFPLDESRGEGCLCGSYSNPTDAEEEKNQPIHRCENCQKRRERIAWHRQQNYIQAKQWWDNFYDQILEGLDTHIFSGF